MTQAGWMDAQEGDGAGTSLAATVEHYGDGSGSPELSYGDGKNRARERKNGDGTRAL